ncbi:MAG TPA: ATP F0F1 synthase subunit gamma, partial [Porphyromonadaceae bacterium]|nr:ATP F0F1 synthase subunit gamma [Porphyromonadaceae bacterium]
MASLKEIKSRIQSVRSTHKITSAMMMISSSKLRKMQRLIQNLSPYEERMAHLMKTLMQADHDFVSPFTRRREVKRVAIVAFSSNTGLVGRFNDNIIETLKTTVDSYAHLGKENILLYPIGNKIQNAVKKLQLTGQAEAQRVVADHPSYDSARQVAEKLLSLFLAEEIDKVELIYHHYQSKSRQILTRETFLPIEPDTQTEETSTDYIFEPDKQT